MKKSLFGRTFTAAILGVALVVAGVVPFNHGTSAPVAHAASPLPWTYKSFTLAPYGVSDLYNDGPALQQLASTGANSVTIAVSWYTDNVYSTNIYRTNNTASDASVVWAIQQAHADGLQVILAPHLDSLDGAWRANINPTDYTTWFNNYTSMIDHYATLAQQNGVVMLYVGAELIDMSTNSAYNSQWRTLIAGVRQLFSGKLSYSANWGSGSFATEYPHISWWDALDYLGISSYFELANTTTPTLSGMLSSWSSWVNNNIAPFQKQWNKPVIFTEGGYRSGNMAAEHPWDSSTAESPDQQQQANCYESLFETFANVPWFAGAMFWYWSQNTSFSSSDTDYPVQGKQAFNTVAAWYGQSGTAPSPTPTSTTVPTATFTPAPASTPTKTPTPTSTPTQTPVPASTPTQTPTPTKTATVGPSPTATSTPTPVSGGLMIADFEASNNGFAGNSDVTNSGWSNWAATVASGSYSLWNQYSIPNSWSEVQLSKAINTDLSPYSTLSASVYPKSPTVAGTGVKVRFMLQGSDGNFYASNYQNVPSDTRTTVTWSLGTIPRNPVKVLYVCWQFTTASTSTGNEMFVDAIRAS